MARTTPTGRRQYGFSYLLELMAVAAAGVGLAAAGIAWDTTQRQDDEAQLLYAGHQYRLAIARYYLADGQSRYPSTLEDLLKDPRTPALRRHLRQPYRDPLGESAPWVPIMAPEGGIMGVRSASNRRPLKTANFEAEHSAFEALAELRGERLSYADWEFVFLPPGIRR